MDFTCKDFPGLIMHHFERVTGEDRTAARCPGCKAVYDTDFVEVGQSCPTCNSGKLAYRKTWMKVCKVCGAHG